MIVGLGMDLVRTERVWAVLQRKGQRARQRLFSAAEAARCDQSRHPPESYAARFAAKEALFKALGTGWGIGGAWTEVEVVSAESGAPSLRLTGLPARLAAERGVTAIHVTLTHAGEYAAAVVVLEAAG